MDALNDGAKRRPVVNFQRGAVEKELSGVGKTRQFVEAFDGGADGVEQLIAGQRDEIAPRDTVPICPKRCACISCRAPRAVSSFSVSRRRKSR